MYISPQASYTFNDMQSCRLMICQTCGLDKKRQVKDLPFLERITGLEPATFALARRRSTK